MVGAWSCLVTNACILFISDLLIMAFVLSPPALMAVCCPPMPRFFVDMLVEVADKPVLFF